MQPRTTRGTLPHAVFPRTAGPSWAVALSLVAAGSTVRATPPLVAAAAGLSASARRAVLGSDAWVDALWVRPGGAITAMSMPLDAVRSVRGDDGTLSVGAVYAPTLDQSIPYVGADVAQARYGVSGAGTLVGVVDTGLDVSHGDFRNADGTTRVRWLLDYTQTVVGRHPELEAVYAIERQDGTYGAVYDASDLDAALASGAPASLPQDTVGHGTYVASIAASNGRATGRYAGVAPESGIVAVRAAVSQFSDAVVAMGAQFIADRATALAMPVVLNLSLGSHFGAHDGSSTLERALETLYPRDAPGRAVVVSAGNDGALPIHARLDLASDFPSNFALTLAGAPSDDPVVVLVAYEGTATVGAAFPSGDRSPEVAFGSARAYGSGDAVASIANATDAPDPAPSETTLQPGARVHPAIVVFAGDPSTGRTRPPGHYGVFVRGAGTVHAWIGNRGVSSPLASFDTPSFDTTVSVPATSRAVISVGAISTRFDYGGTPAVAAGAVSLFSAVGPNRVDQPVPDLTAPGEWVVAALSEQTQVGGLLSIFPSHGFVADHAHAASHGSSASAPHVAGTIALLFQRHPSATLDDVRAALVAASPTTTGGTDGWSQAQGFGRLDVVAALAALDGLLGTAPSGAWDATRSTLDLTRTTAVVGEPVEAVVGLHQTDGSPAFGSHNVTVLVDGVPAATLALTGNVAIGSVAPNSSGDLDVSAQVDGLALAQHATLHVVVSADNPSGGLLARGGCSAGPPRSGGPTIAALAAVLLLAARRKKLPMREQSLLR